MQLATAVTTEFGVLSMSFVGAMRAADSIDGRASAILPLLVELSCDDTGRNGDDSVSKYHHDGSKHLAKYCFWGDISVTHSCDGDDGPINTFRYTGKTVFFSLYEIHNGSHRKDHKKHSS